MLARFRPRLTYANVVSTMCLFILLGGAAYAATKLPKNSVGSEQIEKNAVNSAKVKNRTLGLIDFSSAARAGLKGAPGTPGAPGQPGAAGATHLYMQDRMVDVPSGELKSQTALCGAGDRAVGGGAQWPASSSTTAGTLILVNSYATLGDTSEELVQGQAPTSWTVTGYNNSGDDHFLMASVVCARP